MPERITILGDGAMATVCSIMLTQRGHQVLMWGALEENIERLFATSRNRRTLPGVKVPDTVRLTANDADCFQDCTLALSAVPTQYLRASWGRVARYLPAGVPVVSVTKGIENGTLLRPSQIIAEIVGAGHGIAVLSGPNIAGPSWPGIARRPRWPHVAIWNWGDACKPCSAPSGFGSIPTAT